MNKAITFFAIAIISISSAFAQKGSFKFSGLIVDDRNETQMTMVSVYQMNEANGDDRLLVGQDVIVGNEWFDVQLELDQNYQMVVLSNNGEERILDIDTHGQEMDKNRFKYAMKFNMTGADLDITHSFLNTAEAQHAYTGSTQLGEIAFSNKAEAFIYNRYDAQMLTAQK